jgi:hypothetical protein
MSKPKYTCCYDLDCAIELFFEDCDDNGIPYTTTGLAIACDLDRHQLIQYSSKEPFYHTIKNAKRRVEQYAEKRLFESNVAGVIFNLKNNHKWVDQTDSNINLNKPAIPDISDDITDQQAQEIYKSVLG